MKSAVGRARRGLLVDCPVGRVLLLVVAIAAVSSPDAVAQGPTQPAALDQVSSPLLGIILTVGLLLLVFAFGLGVDPRDWRVPKGLRERLSALWEPSPLYAAADARRRGPPGFVSKAPAGAKRAGADGAKKPSSPGKAKRLPSLKKPPGKPAKPTGAVKPPKVSKPPRSGKPASWAKAKPSARVKPPTRRRMRSRSQRAELRAVDERPSPTADSVATRKAVTCSIFGWRDGEVADFYAVAFGLQGRDWIVERSPLFHWPAGGVPGEAYEAHAILVDALVRAGWRPTGKAGAWYRQCFERAINPVSERS